MAFLLVVGKRALLISVILISFLFSLFFFVELTDYYVESIISDTFFEKLSVNIIPVLNQSEIPNYYLVDKNKVYDYESNMYQDLSIFNKNHSVLFNNYIFSFDDEIKISSENVYYHIYSSVFLIDSDIGDVLFVHSFGSKKILHFLDVKLFCLFYLVLLFLKFKWFFVFLSSIILSLVLYRFVIFLYSRQFDFISEGILVLDSKRKIISLNSFFSSISGIEKSFATDKSIFDLNLFENVELLSDKLNSFDNFINSKYSSLSKSEFLSGIKSENFVFELKIKHSSNGSIKWLSITINPYFTLFSGFGYFILLKDISSKITLEHKLYHVYNFNKSMFLLKNESEIFSNFMKTLKSSFGYNNAFLYLFNSETKHVILKNYFGYKKKSFNRILNQFNDNSLIYDISTRLSPIYIAHVNSKLKFDCGDDIKSILMIPINLDNQFLGFISVESTKFNNFDKNDIRVLSMMTGLLAIKLRFMRIESDYSDYQKVLDSEVISKTKQLRTANDDLKKLDALKSEFLSIVGHELRTPLTSIKGYSDFLLSSKDGVFDKKKKGYVEIILSESNRLMAIINDMLDLNKIKSGNLSLYCTNFNLVDLIKNLAIIDQFKSSEVNFKFKCLNDSIIFNGDKDKFIQILTNLLSNSLKYTVKGNVTLICSVDDNFLHIVVKDTGVGIDKDDLKKIFNEFYQVENSLVRLKGGSGLGLSIVKKLVELHGGTIKVKSKVGVGSSFIVDIPLKRTFNNFYSDDLSSQIMSRYKGFDN